MNKLTTKAVEMSKALTRFSNQIKKLGNNLTTLQHDVSMDKQKGVCYHSVRVAIENILSDQMPDFRTHYLVIPDDLAPFVHMMETFVVPSSWCIAPYDGLICCLSGGVLVVFDPKAYAIEIKEIV